MSDENSVSVEAAATTDIAPIIEDTTPTPSDKRPNDQPEQPSNAGGAASEPGRATRKRPRLDLSVLGVGAEADAPEGRERKRGKTMFGILVGTLNKAKNEDKERNASEAAKKRQQIEQRLQDKLKKETDSVRRAEEAKKDKTHANRKEEDLQLKDSIYKLRRTRLPLLSNFLLTSDNIPSDFDDTSPSPFTDPLAPVSRGHPPPLYYLPTVLLPQQEAYLKRRKAEVQEAAGKEWLTFKDERAAGVTEINSLRQKVAEEDAKRKTETPEGNVKDDIDMDGAATKNETSKQDGKAQESSSSTKTTQDQATSAAKSSSTTARGGDDVEMDVDDGDNSTKEKGKGSSSKPASSEGKDKGKKNDDENVPMQADDDDAVEY